MNDDDLGKYSIDIECNSCLFILILKYGATFDGISNFTSESIERNDTKDNNYEVELRLPYGISNIIYDNEPIIINYQRCVDRPVATSYNVKTLEFLNLYSDVSTNHLKSFILDAKKFNEPKKNNDVVCRILKNTVWILLSKLPKRESDSIFLPGTQKEDIYNDIEKFINSEDDYEKYGIPYKRNYLLEGLPGTGKTSLIFSIASKFNLDIAIINFSPKIDDNIFMSAISNLPNNSILLLEDIDSLFIDRKSSSENFSMISFSAILNVLDGIARKNKMITFMTTNYIDRIDDALKRPGRIDYMVSFKSATMDQIKNMFISFFPNLDEIPKNILSKIKNNSISTAILQKFLFENRNSKNIIENIDKLFEFAKCYNYNSLYI